MEKNIVKTNEMLVLENQLEICREELYHCKMRELECFCSSFKEMIVKCLMLEKSYDLTMADEVSWFELGHTKYGDIQTFMLDSIQVVKRFCNTLSNDLSNNLIKGLFNKKRYIDSISHCLNLFKILVKTANNIECNLQDAIDRGRPNGIDDVAMAEFKDMLKHSLSFLEKMTNNYEYSSLRMTIDAIERIREEYKNF